MTTDDYQLLPMTTSDHPMTTDGYQVVPMTTKLQTLKLLFRFSALETLFLEHSKSVKMTQKSQI